MESSTTTDVLLPLVTAGAAISVAALTLLQTDRVSRWTLSPARLMARRRQEYAYHWKVAVERAFLQLDYALAGGKDNFNGDPEINLKNTAFLGSDAEQDDLIQRILSKQDHQSKFSVLKLDRDPSDPKEDFYLFLMRHREDCEPEFFQVPLVSFCVKLCDAFENQLTTTTLCFVAEASSGKASDLLENLVKEAKTGVAVLSEPLWMVNLARIAEARIYPTAKLERITFALCRLDAWALRDQVKTSHTIMVILPGQATVATLLPLVQKAFPQDRHLFAYDGCVASVARGIQQSSTFRRGTIQTEPRNIISKLSQNPVRHAIPLPSKTPLTKSLLGLENALSQLPLSHAQGVESWMSSVDAFFKLKSDETNNGYIPYVFKLSFLTNPVGNFAPGSDSFWSLSSLLQYITGTKSRSVPEGVIDAARESLLDYNRDHADPLVNISDMENKAIENCVFQHKSILIGNKTLMDTVLPTQHWSLKQASRAGCSCCGPDPYDEQDDEEEKETTAASDGRMKVAGVDMNVPGAFATLLDANRTTNQTSGTNNRGYVDGKTSFAFDPSKFS